MRYTKVFGSRTRFDERRRCALVDEGGLLAWRQRWCERDAVLEDVLSVPSPRTLPAFRLRRSSSRCSRNRSSQIDTFANSRPVSFRTVTGLRNRIVPSGWMLLIIVCVLEGAGSIIRSAACALLRTIDSGSFKALFSVAIPSLLPSRPNAYAAQRRA